MVSNATSDVMEATTIATSAAPVVLDYEVGFYTDMFLVVLTLFGTAAIATVLNVFLLYVTVKNRLGIDSKHRRVVAANSSENDKQKWGKKGWLSEFSVKRNKKILKIAKRVGENETKKFRKRTKCSIVLTDGPVFFLQVLKNAFYFRSLHNTYNRLVAITAFCDCLHCISYSVSVYHALIGKNMTPILSCFYMQIYAVPAWTMSCALLLLVAIDRLVAILFPIW